MRTVTAGSLHNAFNKENVDYTMLVLDLPHTLNHIDISI